MIKNKHIAILVTLMFALTMFSPAAYALNFSDISGHWAEDQIKSMTDEGIINGYPEGTFQPDGKITRAEFASLLVTAFGLTKGEGKSFTDTVDHWAKDAIAAANAAGIVNGYSDTIFGPDDPITREQMAVMIVKAARLTDAAHAKTFADSSSISDWAKEAVDIATSNQLISGYPDNTFQPQGNATRAEATAVLSGVLKKSTPPAKPAEKVEEEQEDTVIEKPVVSTNRGGGSSSSSSSSKTKISAISVSGEGGATEITIDGDTLQMVAEVQPANASNKAVTWDVDRYDLAEIDETGLLTALYNGDVKVTATAKDGSNVEGEITITISNQKHKVREVNISGVPVVGRSYKLFSLTPGSASEKVDFQWQRSDDEDEGFIDIDGATSDTYNMVSEDLDKYIRLKVTGKDTHSGTAVSNPRKIWEGYTITFDTQGGTLSGPDLIKVDNGLPFGPLPDVTRTGYDFLGWFTQATGGMKITEGSYYNINYGNKLYAQWRNENAVLLLGDIEILNTGDTYLKNDGEAGTSSEYNVHFDGTNNLTLKDYDGGPIQLLKEITDGLTINLEGTNKVEFDDDSFGDAIYVRQLNDSNEHVGDANLTIEGTGSLETEGGIFSYNGHVTIKGGTIEITAGGISSSFGDVIFSGGEISVKETMAYYSIGTQGEIKIKDSAKLSIDATSTQNIFSGIKATKGISIEDTAKVTIDVKGNGSGKIYGLHVVWKHDIEIANGATVEIITAGGTTNRAIFIAETEGKFIVDGNEVEIPTGANYKYPTPPTTKIETVTITGFVGAETGNTPITKDDLQTTDTNYKIVGLTWYEYDSETKATTVFTGTEFSNKPYEAVIELSVKDDYHFVPKGEDKTVLSISEVNTEEWHVFIGTVLSTSEKLFFHVSGPGMPA